MRSPFRRTLLLPLAPVYAALIKTKNLLLDRGILPRRRLGHPVISVGSVSAGGAGKTPAVMMLAELLQRRGFEVRILTRGYGRAGRAIQRVEQDVDQDGVPAEFGDEPVLMARRLKSASVWVGAARHRAGTMSERSDTPQTKAVYLLDDGFQHRKLARDVDMVLLTGQDLKDRLLPAGNLREPISALSRADVILVREDEAHVAALVDAVTNAPERVWLISRTLKFTGGASIPLRPVVFCGLARPENFLSMLSAEGIVPVAFSKFRDHHPYSASDIDRLVETAGANNADGFLTTEKDAVKLTAAMKKRLESIGPVVVPELCVHLTDEQARMDQLLTMLEALQA